MTFLPVLGYQFLSFQAKKSFTGSQLWIGTSNNLKPPLRQFFDHILILHLVLCGGKLFHWSFNFLLVVEVSWVQKVIHGLEHVVICGRKVWTTCQLWHQFNSLKFLEFILEIDTYANFAKLLTHSCMIQIYSKEQSLRNFTSGYELI